MATRFLSFLDDVAEALRREATANLGLTWDTNRMVNYHHGLARMTLVPPPYATDPAQLRGAIFVQNFLLNDGSLCIKVSLNWHGSDAFPMVPIYAKSPVDWKKEAERIAALWLAGPPPTNVTTSALEYSALLAIAS